jgi:hypothetical protein
MQYVDLWEHAVAKERFLILQAKLGSPLLLCNQPGGLAIWNKRDDRDPFLRHQLRDERILRCPALGHKNPTIDNVYSFMKVYIKPELLPDLQRLFSPLVYDGLTKEMRVRTETLEENSLIAIAVLKFVNDNLDPLEEFKKASILAIPALNEMLLELIHFHHLRFASLLVGKACVFQRPYDTSTYKLEE